MASLIVLLVVGLAAVLVFFNEAEQRVVSRDKNDEPDTGEWKYGDAWKQGSPDEPAAEDDVEYVAILRGETGRGYNDTLMQDLVLFLGSEGIRAKYDSYPLEQIQIYVLNVEAGKVQEAREQLNRKFQRDDNAKADP
jgi:hypothetical protein